MIEAHIWNFTVNYGREKEGLMPAIKLTEPEVDMIISVLNLLVKTSHLPSSKDKEVSKCGPTMSPQGRALMPTAASATTLMPLCPWGLSQPTTLHQ